MGGRIRDANGRTLLERDVLRKTMKLRSARNRFLGVSSGATACDVNAIAFLYGADAVADRGDYACAIYSGSPGELRLDGISARTHHGFKRIDTRGVNIDEDFSGAGLRVGNFFENEFLWTTEFMNTNGFHSYLLSS
jgi:hypothetical protein